MKTMSLLQRFCRQDQGQDLIEYTLVVAFLAMTAAAVFIGAGGSTAAIWTSAGNTVNSAATAANNCIPYTQGPFRSDTCQN